MLQASSYDSRAPGDAWAKGNVPAPRQITKAGQLRKAHIHIREQSEAYEGLFREQQKQLEELRQEFSGMAQKVHTMEDDLAGSKAATKAVKATLEQQTRENQRLGASLQKLSAQDAWLRGALGVSHRQLANTQARLQVQGQLLELTSRRSELQRLLLSKKGEKSTLEAQIRTVRAALQTEENTTAGGVAVVGGVLFGLLTGGIGGLVLGAAAGGTVGKCAMENGKWACTAKQAAELSSLQEKLRLVDQAIAKLDQEIAQIKIT